MRSSSQASSSSPSETVITEPPDRSSAAATSAWWIGSTIRIAEATVSARDAGLDGMEARQRTGRGVEAARVRLRVAAAAVRQREHVGQRAELLDDLGGRRHLALDAVGVRRVDEQRARLGRELLRRAVRVGERAFDLDDPPADSAHLDELRARRAAGGDDDHRLDARARRVRGARRGGVAGRRADDARDAALDGARHGDAHAAVLERAGRVRALPLEPELDAEALRQARRREQRRASFAERDHERETTARPGDRPCVSAAARRSGWR